MLSVFLIASILVVAHCGAVPRRYGSGRIVGGEDAAIADVPYQAGLIRQDKIVCGGSVISANVILSAAQCAIAPANEWRIRVGTNKNYDPNNEDGQIVDVSKIIAHEDFDDWDIDYDVALFFAATPLVIDGINVRPIGLPTQGQVIPDGTLVTASGWGDLEQGGASGRPTILQKVVIPTVSQSVCQECYDELFLYINTRSICAGLVGVGGKDACQGDSGGPLAAGSLLVGITSWGVGCAGPNFPGVYARVPALSDWIKTNMQV